MKRCADCRHLAIETARGEILVPPVDFRMAGVSVVAGGQGTVRCRANAFALADEANSRAGSPRAPEAVIEVLWQPRGCSSYAPVLGPDDGEDG